MLYRTVLLGAFAGTAQASYESIFNYKPNSKVTDHNALDRDQAAMEGADCLGKSPNADFTAAKSVYQNGGSSKSYFEISSADAGLANTYTKSTGKCGFTLADGTVVTAGSLKDDVGATDAVKCLYPTSEIQASYQACQVGGLPAASQVTTGCVDTAVAVTISDGTNSDTISVGYTATNKAGRTLQGFGTSSTTTGKMFTNSASCPGCPYATYTKYYQYYGVHSYMDDYVTAALDGTSLTFTSSGGYTGTRSYDVVADFSALTGRENELYRIEGTKKGSAYMNVWMYTIREFEDAIDDCSMGSLDNNYGSVHAWDEGVAFYSGSLEGADGSGSGKMVAALADKRCQNFNTCGASGGATTGTSQVNLLLLDQFQIGRNHLMVNACQKVRPIVNRIVQLMTIPLVQGTLRYAYKMGKYGPGGANTADGESNAKSNAEGATFAFAVLPLVHSCDASAAETIYNNMKLGAVATTDHAKVKDAFESVYPCLGITCAEVGALTVGGGLVADDAWGTVCSDASTQHLSASVVYEPIAGYIPRSKVTDHNAVDLDQAAMEVELGKATPDFTAAKAIYTEGGNSKAYATITVSGVDTNGAATPALSKGTAVAGITTGGASMSGKLKSDADAGATSYDIIYNTNAVQATYNGGCQVGGLVTTTTTGCIAVSSTVVIGWTAVTATAVVNKAGRTLRGFGTSTTTTGKMFTTSTSCPGCPYVTYSAFYNYYGDHSYMDDYVTAALDGTAYASTSGKEADFSALTGRPNELYRIEGAKKGSAYMNVWMYTIREFEDAIDDCSISSIDNNYDAAHAWDEGVAFYTGSLEGTDGSGSGKMIYNLADKRCQNFATCGADANAETGTSHVNLALFQLFAQGEAALYQNNCAIRPIINRVISLMTIPLVQGTLRYAYKMGKYGPGGANSASDDSNAKSNAEGATFAFAVLPLVHACDSAAAETIYNNMKLGAVATTDHAKVKDAFESVYPCLGITCAEVGALTVGGGLVADDAWGTVCTDPVASSASESLPAGALIGIIVAASLAVLFLICICFMYRAEKKGTPIFQTLDGGKPHGAGQVSNAA